LINVKNNKDVKSGMILPGIVNNITNFGCFVDGEKKAVWFTSRSSKLAL
jgi:transcriptional accessory protein Tex/SPT6